MGRGSVGTFVCVCMCLSVCVEGLCTRVQCPPRFKERVLHPLELEVAVSCLVWMLGTPFKSSAHAICALSHVSSPTAGLEHMNPAGTEQ